MRSLLITGGAGFIGVNAAHGSRAGWAVRVDAISPRGPRRIDGLRSQIELEFVPPRARRGGVRGGSAARRRTPSSTSPARGR